MTDDYPHKAKDKVEALIGSLRAYIENDPEQEVQGIALPVLDAALTEIKAAVGNDRVVESARDLISPESIEAGEPVRAVDALLVAEQLDAAIGRRPARVLKTRGSPFYSGQRRLPPQIGF